MKHWLIIYDIRDTKRLQRIAKLMEGFGVRVQKSVFECFADMKTIKIIRSKVFKIIDEDSDFVVYFDICEKDWQKRMKYGPKEFLDKDEKTFEII